MKTFGRLFILLVCFAGISLAKFSEVRAGNPVIKIDGSSTVYPITEAVAEEFQKANRNTIHVTVGISGTGGGFKKFCRGEIDLSDASRPISENEIELCKSSKIEFIELPIAYDGLAVVVNSSNTWVSSIKVEELKKIWEPQAQGVVMKWNQIRKEWPNLPIKLYGPGTDSGTFDYFTEAVVGKARSSRGDYTASEDDNVLVQGVSGDKNALGYFGYAYYAENKNRLKVLAINNGVTDLFPSEKTVENGTYRPLSRPLFIYVNKSSLNKTEVKNFVAFYLKQAPVVAKEVKFFPLPTQAYKLVKDRFNYKKTGTVFSGHSKVGLTIEELLKRENR